MRLTSKTGPGDRSHVPLSKERVIQAATLLADAGGVASLTMRRLAEKLGVEAMSLYYHVANKDEIIDGMVDNLFGEIVRPSDGGDWKAAMRERAISARAVLLRHRWAIGLMESRPNPGPETLKHHESVIGCLRSAGFSIPMAAHAFSTIDSYIYGFAMQEESLPFESPAELEAVAKSILERMPPEEFPFFTEMIVEYNLKPDYSYANEFEFGLDLILDGFERSVNLPR